MSSPAARRPRDDDLFSPTLVGRRRTQLPPGKRPWRLSSQFYVSALGGPVSAGLAGYLNGQRLGLPRERLVAIAGTALALLVAAVVVIALIGSEKSGPMRIVFMVGGALAYLPIRELQKDADRRYVAITGTHNSYDSILWRPAILLVVGGVFLAAVAVVPVAQ